ncbi:MAG: hypothetical protein ACP5IV_07870, partial [Caldisericia bacterium]
MKRYNNVSKIEQSIKYYKKSKKDTKFKKFLENFYRRNFSFLSKIYISLNESGIKISFLLLFFVFILYLFIFFMIGFSFFSNWFFPKLPQTDVLENIANND